MIIYLAGNGVNQINKEINHNYNRLDSYFYLQRYKHLRESLKLMEYKRYILDSGAYSFLGNLEGEIPDWDNYIEGYAELINEHDIKLFFELDIDNLVGYDEVLRLRKKLHQLTNKKSIPVWHKARGIEEFYKMCDEFEYVAIGGIVSKEIKKTEFKILPYFINIAHQHNLIVKYMG